MSGTQYILVAGATGMLGAQIAERLLQRGAKLALLVRESTPSDPQKAALLEKLVAQGATLRQADLRDAAALRTAMANVGCVVSALQGGPEVIVDAQINLAQMAAESDVRRFIPSDFSVDFMKLPEGAHPNLDLRREADRVIGTLPMEMTNIFIGGFMDIVFAPFFQIIDFDKATVGFFGEPDQEFDVTTVADTARFVATVAMEERPIAGPFGVVGDKVSSTRLVELLSQTHGRPFQLFRKGSISDLEAWIAKEQQAGRAHEWSTIGAQYQWAMMSGAARITDPLNARYPEIEPTSVAAFLQHAARSSEAR